jgi:hypothetical protein
MKEEHKHPPSTNNEKAVQQSLSSEVSSGMYRA